MKMTWGQKQDLRRALKILGLSQFIVGFILGMLDLPLQALICFGAALGMIGWALNDENHDNKPTGTT